MVEGETAPSSPSSSEEEEEDGNEEDDDDEFVVRISHVEGQLCQVQFSDDAYNVVPKEFKTQGGFDLDTMSYKFDVSRSGEVEKALNGFVVVRAFASYADVVPNVVPPDASPYEEALVAVLNGHHVFVTGEAGTGKSQLLRTFCNRLDGNTVLCATSGSAAKSLAATIGVIEGIAPPVTVHTAIGVTVGDVDRLTIDELIAKTKQARAKAKAKPIDALVIDEVSMLSAYMFELVVRLLAVMGDNVQLIVVGDFAQLPPVFKNVDGAHEAMGRFAFESVLWHQTFKDNVFLLNRNYRILNTTSDPEAKAFLEMLSRIRLGTPIGDDVERLTAMNSFARPVTDDHTHLLPKLKGVERINAAKLRKLTTPIHTYPATVAAFAKATAAKTFDPLPDLEEGLPPAFFRRVEAVVQGKPKVQVAVGARVRLTRNRDVERGLVNGTVGTVVSSGGAEGDGAVVVRFDDVAGDTLIKPEIVDTLRHREGGKSFKATVSELPLQVAWASTIHRSQGCTLSQVAVDFGEDNDLFSPGQAYVALSRVRHPSGMVCDHAGAIETGVLVDGKVVVYYTETVPGLERARRERVAAEGTLGANPAMLLGVPFRRRDVKSLLPRELGRTPLLHLHQQYRAHIGNQTTTFKRRRLGIPEPPAAASSNASS